MNQPERVIITSEKRTGKTRLCNRIARLGRQAGLDVRGLISPAVFEEGRKVGIKATDLKNNQTRYLARLTDEKVLGHTTETWSFDAETIQWGNQVLTGATPCDLLIIDELGPLEFNRGEGWIKGFNVIDRGNFKGAIIVVRPAFLGQACERWPAAVEIELDPKEDISHLAAEIFRQFHFT